MDNFKNIINSGYRQMLKDTAPKIVSKAKGVIPYDVVDDIVYALKYGNRAPKVGTNATINTLYKTKITPNQATNYIKNAIGNVDKAKVLNAGKVLPYIGDVINIGQGGYQAFHGHPFVGTGQAAIGAASLLGDLYTGGRAGTILTPLAKQAYKALSKNLMTKGGRVLSTAIPNLLYLNNDDNPSTTTENVSPSIDKVNEFNINKSLGSIPKQNVYPIGGIQSNNIPVVSDGISKIIARETSNNNQQPSQEQMVQEEQSAQVPIDAESTEYVSAQPQPDYSLALLEAIQQQQQANTDRYIRDLDRYRYNLPFAQLTDYLTKRSNAGYAAALHNPYLANIGSIGNVDYVTELPKISKEQASVLNNLLSSNIGRYANMQAARDAGLSPLTGLSDKTLLQQIGGLKKAYIAADTKKYSTDKYLEGRQLASQTQLQIQQMKNAIQEKLLDRTLSTKERMQLRDLQNKLNIAERRNLTNLELGKMGAFSRPYSMGVGLTPEYGKLFGINYNQSITPEAGGIDPAVLNNLLRR